MHRQPLEKLKQLTGTLNVTVPVWLEDLVLNGPRYEQWIPAKGLLYRMALTEFLARWLKAAGLSQEQTLEWLLEYTFQTLAQFAKTGRSGIRHGTKGNTRWVYNSDFSFDFDAIANQPLSPDWMGKPAYMPVFAHWQELLPLEKKKAQELRIASAPPMISRSVKERHREKYEEGLKIAREKQAADDTLEQIVQLLNETGFPTRTGRKWTQGTLYQSLRGK